LFSSLDESFQTKVTLGKYIQVTFLGKGGIKFFTKQGEEKVLSDVYYVSGLKHNMMRTGQLLQKGYIIYMEDNHCVIMDKFPSNQLIEKILMRSNNMFPLTLNPTKKKNTVVDVGKEKYAQSYTSFTVESARSSNEENSVHNIKKRENGAKIKVAFQYEIQDDS
jgi:hypothetical protein